MNLRWSEKDMGTVREKKGNRNDVNVAFMSEILKKQKNKKHQQFLNLKIKEGEKDGEMTR